MKTNSNQIYAGILRLICVLLLGAFLAGCATVNQLREAQDAFNRGAAAENQFRLASATAVTDPAVANSVTAARINYEQALTVLNEFEDKEQKSLQRDGLWGNVLALKAMCEWRLGQYSNALATIEKAPQSADRLLPRDKALTAALPGLIKSDQAYSKISNPGEIDACKELLIGENGAIANIQQARGQVEPNHPVQIYLIQCQLAAYRNYVTLRKIHRISEPEPEHVRAESSGRLKDLRGLATSLENADTADALVKQWAKLCGLPVPP